MNGLAEKVLSDSGLETKLVDEILTIGRLKKIKAGDSIDSAGMNEMPIVLSGLLKISRQEMEGGEVFLYFLEPGQTCAMSITCCSDGKKPAVHVLAEEDSELWMIPVTDLDVWLARYGSFRRYVFSVYQDRFEEMLSTIDSVVFLKLDKRLYKYLLDKKQASGSYIIHKTHEQIANELNTSRVVISRLLKQLEREEKIEQYRNRIEVL